MYRTTRRYGLQSTIFATNPWALIKASIKERCPHTARAEALATIVQAEQFYRAASEAQLWASKPLLLYYSFMNLAKALSLTAGLVTSFDQAKHGLTEQLRPGRRELIDAFLKAFRSPTSSGELNLFAEFLRAVSGRLITTTLELDVVKLLPQIVTGHRIWCEVTGEKERFVSIDRIEIMQDKDAKTLWLRLNIFADDLTRLGVSHEQLIEESQLQGGWREVTPDEETGTGRKLLRFEQKDVVSYTGRVSDAIPGLVEAFRHSLWAVVTIVPPYRKYYLYMAPTAEHQQVLPQTLSFFALVYYLGSITRYRPQHFDAIVEGEFGGLVQEILTNQPNQFLYLLSSEFAKREVTRAAIV